MSSADRAIRLALAVVGSYLVVTLVPAIGFGRPTGVAPQLLVHGVVLALVGLAIGFPEGGPTPLRVVRDWLPLALMLFTYVELRWLIGAVGRPHLDAMVQRWEAAVFSGSPSQTLAVRFHSMALSETLHVAYLSFYAIVVVPPALLYLRGRRDAFASTVLSLTLVYVVGSACFLAFPVDGPRYVFGPAHAPDGPVRAAVLHVLSAGSSPGTAFPSLHVSASIVASYCALRYQRAVGYVVAVLTVGLAAGAVYGGFHYGVDVIAGLAVGCLCAIGGAAAWSALGGDGRVGGGG